MKKLMKIVEVTDTRRFLKKLDSGTSNKQKIAASILRDVSRNGDAAIKKYEKRFGAPDIASLRVSKQQIASAYSRVSEKDIAAIRLARLRLARTESAVKRQLTGISVDHGGTRISKSFVPIDSVGCYVPGGGARYPSSAIMSVTPARIAGVKRIVVVSPPDGSGNIDPLTVVASDMCGATEIYRTGGAQSIAALAYGTRSIDRVDKIVGPGGIFVTLAKYIASNVVSIDMMAGPTELGIIVDSTTDMDLAALDIISQAEHSADASCYAFTTSSAVAKRLQSRICSKIQDIPRKKIIESSLASNGFIAVCKNTADIITLVNGLAPEHLEIMSSSEKKWKNIKNPGLVLIGANTPSSASDYLLGSNHILPTNGFGKTRGALSVLDFVKVATKVKSTRADLQRIAESMKAMTEAEGLPNHYNALKGRIQ